MNVLLCHSMTELNIDNICVIHALYTSYSMPEWGRKRIDSDSLWHIYKVSISSTCHNLVLRWRQYLKIQIFKLKFKFKICLLSTTTCRWNTWYIIMWHQYPLYIYIEYLIYWTKRSHIFNSLTFCITQQWDAGKLPLSQEAQFLFSTLIVYALPFWKCQTWIMQPL